jgi:hypothetical protein
MATRCERHRRSRKFCDTFGVEFRIGRLPGVACGDAQAGVENACGVWPAAGARHAALASKMYLANQYKFNKPGLSSR